jgi:hypothetical protein
MDINDVRQQLFETMKLLAEKKITVEEAKSIAEIGQVLVNSAKVEVDIIRAGGGRSTFVPLESDAPKEKRPAAVYSNKSPLGIASSK